MKYFNLAFIILAILFSSCKSEGTKNAADTDKAITDENIEVSESKYTLSPFTPSQSYPDAVLSNMQYKKGKFSFDVKSDTYKLGSQTPDAGSKMCANSAEGQHIHLIVDNSPYAAKYESTFDYEVADGDHTIMAFISRSYHESIKTESSHILKNVTVKDKSIVSSTDVTTPTITYSRPKGKYVGDDAKKVMLDFYVSNVNWADGFAVSADINGEVHTLDKWQPYYIEGLPMGVNKITLTLLKDGNPVDSPMNTVTRTFELLSDPTPTN